METIGKNTRNMQHGQASYIHMFGAALGAKGNLVVFTVASSYWELGKALMVASFFVPLLGNKGC